VLGALFEFVRNQGDCWGAIVDALERHLDDVQLPQTEDADAAEAAVYVHPLNLPTRLGERTAQMHLALAMDSDDPAFAPEPITAGDLRRWSDAAMAEANTALNSLAQNRHHFDDRVRPLVDQLLAARADLEGRLNRLTSVPASGVKTRIHGDYHLGQALVAEHDVVIIDFEGEPRRSLEERREKMPPQRDMGGMLRSLDYAAWAALDGVASRVPDLPARVTDAATAWRDWASQAFLESYFETVSDATGDRDGVASPSRELLEMFLLQKAFYEINYEAANRPSWLPIPIRGVLALLSDEPKEKGP
jgi:maltose alpha-D-glucosyltransferase/alpha-amylase